MWQPEHYAEVKRTHAAVQASKRTTRGLVHVERDVAKDKALAVFMKERGLKKASRGFSLWRLASGQRDADGLTSHVDRILREDYCPIVDHAEYFNWAHEPRRQAALITHVYSDHIDCHRRIGAMLQLHVEHLDWSWYYPDYAMAVMYTRLPDVVDRSIGIMDEHGLVHAPATQFAVTSDTATLCDDYITDGPEARDKRARCLGQVITCLRCITTRPKGRHNRRR